MTAFARQLSAAQRQYDNAYDSGREADERIAEASEELADKYRNNPEKCREAEEWVAGTFEGDHYTDVTLALHQLHHTDPSALMGSDLLTTLYQLAKVEAAAMDAKLLEMATEAVVAETGVEE